jgi:predicted Zn-dependent protease/Flp pilus assembly protein TadD
LKFYREITFSRLLLAVLAFCLLSAGIVARAELERWAQNAEGGGPFDLALFRPIIMPSGAVMARRSPQDSRALLDQMAAKSPMNAEFYLMRARVDEESLDFTAAEADWKKYVTLLPDHAAGELELADFYHRRLRPLEEIEALSLAAAAPSNDSDRLLPATEQRSWKAFESIFAAIKEQALPTSVSVKEYLAWIDRYPKEPAVYVRYFDFQLGKKLLDQAADLIAQYAKVFPNDSIFPVRARASLEYARGSTDAALALYDRSYQPLWPPELVQDYFDLLKNTHRLRDFLASARARVQARPEDLVAASRVFYYYQQESNLSEARQTLVEYRLRMESRKAQWTSADLWDLGRLFEAVHDYNEAARCYYALYSLPGVGADSAEKSLAAISNVLLSAPEQPVHFGTEDFSMVRDIGTLDPYPGFLNGIVSLLLNSQRPPASYSQAESASAPYFHRVEAAELLSLFDSRFPKSPQRAELHAKLIEVYAGYSQSDAVIQSARTWLKEFPDSLQRLHIALLLADALSAANRADEELAVYDQLLNELAARADHVPLGAESESGNVYRSQPQEEISQQPGNPQPFRVRSRTEPQPGVRSPEYARVLDRYIARLVQLKRPMQVLVLFRREIDHNPNDPGLYERFATFLDQNHLGDQTTQVYRLAMRQFPSRSWYHKLARWYLLHREMSGFESLSEQVIRTFSGSDLENYFDDVVSSSAFDAVLYRQLNLYAHQRFPHNLAFVRNLLSAYHLQPTYNLATWEALIRQYWYFDPGLRSQYFSYLSAHSRLDAELEQVRKMPPAARRTPEQLAASDPVAARFIAEADLWRCQYETAAPLMRGLTENYATDFTLDRRTSNLFRSLAAFDPAHTDVAVGIEKNLASYEPGNQEVLVRIGDIYADRSLFALARPYWNRVAQIKPGSSAGYLQAATVFWDYFLFDDALRLIGEARKNLGEPDLFAYQAGAVYEGKRDYDDAIQEYVRGALATDGPSESRSRLLALAKREHVGANVDRLTSEKAAGTNPGVAAVSLRVDVLETLQRRDALGNFLTSLAGTTSSRSMLQKIESVAANQGFDTIQSAVIEREIALTKDPVEKMQLRLRLAGFQESKNDMGAARSTIESLYADNPKILGVVRAAVDFYWDNKMPDAAIHTLLQAASVSYPALKTRFTFEAARKATEAGDYGRARELLAPLIQADPYNAEGLAAMADTYAGQNEQAGLRDFYLDKIKEFSASTLPRDEKIARIAALRRGLIPALTRLKDYTGAIDQYIEILKSFPGDQGLAQEVAAYAEGHALQTRLLAYFQKAVADSPKDYRWPMVLARLETYFEDYPAAIEAYNHAHQVRPDLSDLLMEEGALEERLERFDDAAKTYTILYGLTYQDPQWMDKVAEIRARQGDSQAAETALRKAMIEGRPQTPTIYFAAAARLEQWDMLNEARPFAERGVALAGEGLLTDNSNLSGVRTYAGLMALLRDYPEALTRLESAAQVQHPEQASYALGVAVQEIGRTVATYYTPEEFSALQAYLEKQEASATPQDAERVWLPLAQSAGLGNLEAQWRFKLMMANPGKPTVMSNERRLIELEDQRMKYAELGADLEKYWTVYPLHPDKDRLLTEAATAYRADGDTKNELRVLDTAFSHDALGGDMLNRYFQLLLANEPAKLVTIAGTGNAPRTSTRDAVTNFVVASGDRDLALQTVSARSANLPPVWARAYTGLTGLYYWDKGPAVDGAFRQALGGGTIGERVGKPVDRNEHLAGDVWYYYGSRYGEFLTLAGKNNAEDYLPAPLEATPASPQAYFSLAEYYDAAGEMNRALTEYSHTLELAPNRGDADDRMAQILLRQGRREQATARWKLALEAFNRQQNAAHAPPDFWQNVETALKHIGAAKALVELRPEADSLLRVYIHRNGAYQVEPLLQGVMEAAGDPSTGVAWILDLSQSAPNPLEFLGGIADAQWIPEAHRRPVYEKVLDLAQDQVGKSFGAARMAAEASLNEWRLRWIGYLLDTQETEQAHSAIEALPAATRKTLSWQLAPLEIRIASRQDKLDSLLASYHENPERAPTDDALRTAAMALHKDGDEASARRVLAFMYARAIDRRDFTPANFLGLAELRLESGDAAEAVALLRRMTLIAGNPFQTMVDAGSLLAGHGHPAEATEFFSERVKAAPWDLEARLLLAKAELAANRNNGEAAQSLKGLAGNPRADYGLRVETATVLAPLHINGEDAGSSELNLLAAGQPIGAQAASQPFFVRTRIEAAAHTGNPEEKMALLRDAITVKPENDTARIEFFRAAHEAGHDQLAISAMEPLLGARPNNSQPVPHDRGLEPRFTIAELAGENFSSFLTESPLNPAQKSALARDVAHAYEKLDNLAEAEGYLRIAAGLETSKPVKAEVEKESHGLTAKVDLMNRDAQRRPFVSGQLEQRNVVRPRLLPIVQQKVAGGLSP